MNLTDLNSANRRRQELWTGADNLTPTERLLFISNEVNEEAGEVAGAVKKLVRLQKGIAGNGDKCMPQRVRDLEDEIADTFINLSRLCNELGFHPEEVIRRKFNETSDKVGVEVYL